MAKKKPKATKAVEIVTRCDQCGGALNVSAVRSKGSFACAHANGNVAKCYGSSEGELIYFFCCKACANEFHICLSK